MEETEFPSGGLRRTYRRGRKEFHAARENPTPHNLHLWRKRAKYLWHHFTTLEGIFPEIIEPLGTLQHHLSSLLGEDHDLFILDEFLSAHPAISPDEGSLAPIHEAIARRREELQGEAFALGRKLYLESPAGFVGRMRGYRVEAAT